MNVAAILLCGGQGVRFGSKTPKQFLTLGDKPVALHSFARFLALPQIKEIVVVADPAWHTLFHTENKELTFALPGLTRQASVIQGFLAIRTTPSVVVTHDSARPFMTPSMVEKVIETAHKEGAASCAMPLKFTIKETTACKKVIHTPNRELYAEIQTPQALTYSIFKKGIEKATKEGLSITDDLGFAEILGVVPQLVEGSYQNLKITTAEDFRFAQQFHVPCSSRP